MINAIGKHIQQGTAKALFQTKNATKLNTAGTRHDYLSSRLRTTTTQNNVQPTQPPPPRESFNSPQTHTRSTATNGISSAWPRAVPLTRNLQHTYPHHDHPPTTPQPSETSTIRPAGQQINKNCINKT